MVPPVDNNDNFRKIESLHNPWYCISNIKVMKSSKDFMFSNGNETILTEKLLSARKRGKFCDVQLESCDNSVFAHRAVLASFSPFLERLFNSNDKKFKFEAYDCKTLESVVDFIYSGVLSIDKSSVFDVAVLALELNLKDLHKACIAEITKNIHTDPFGVRLFAVKHNFQQLIQESDKYIHENISDVQQTKQFLQLPRLQVELFTNRQHSNLVKGSDDDQFLMLQVVDWVRRRVQVHGEKLQDLMEESRMVYLQTDHFLKDVMMEECNEVIDLNSNDRQELFKRLNSREHKEITNGHDMIDIGRSYGEFKLIGFTHTSDQTYVGVALLDNRVIAINLHHKSNKARSSRGSFSSEGSLCDDGSPSGGSLVMLAPMVQGKCSMGFSMLENKIYVIGGYNRGNCIHVVECYDAEINEWEPVEPLPTARARLSSVALNGKLYAMGGSDGHSILKSVEIYDSFNNKWADGPAMCEGRCSFGATVYNDNIYAIGGSWDSSALKSCEVLSGNTSKWNQIASMHVPRENVCVVENDGLIYAIGGSHGWTCHNTVEIFDPINQKWSFIASMLSCRRGASAVVYNGKIIVAGGSDGQFALNSVEVYDPTTDSWQTMTPMLTPRNNSGIAVVNNVLHVFGGFGGSSGTEFLNTVECFDEKINDWKIHI